MGKLSDDYPTMDDDNCDRLGQNGYCNEACPKLAREEMIRYKDECYTYREYLIYRNKENMSSVKHLMLEE
jgi:hypothetical protein